jgi:hypothetical protein
MFMLEIMKEEHGRYSVTSKAEKPPFDLHCIGATKNPKTKAKKS